MYVKGNNVPGKQVDFLNGYWFSILQKMLQICMLWIDNRTRSYSFLKPVSKSSHLIPFSWWFDSVVFPIFSVVGLFSWIFCCQILTTFYIIKNPWLFSKEYKWTIQFLSNTNPLPPNNKSTIQRIWINQKNVSKLVTLKILRTFKRASYINMPLFFCEIIFGICSSHFICIGVGPKNVNKFVTLNIFRTYDKANLNHMPLSF